MYKKNKAFTLVELIVVIIILAILWTIAFLSMQWYSVSSRDSVRMSDMKTIETWLELFHLQAWRYPDPTGWTSITYSWWIVCIQWNFWDSVVTNISNINEKPLDPLLWLEYSYSVLNDKQQYQLVWVLEWDLISYNTTAKVNAEQLKEGTAYTVWNYNWEVIKVSSWWMIYLLALPSITTSNISSTDVANIISNNELVFKWYSNLPSSYTWTTYNINWEDNLNILNNFVVYSWSTLPTTNEEINLFVTNLKQAYAWTDLESESNYQKILNLNTSDPETVLSYWVTLMNNNLWTELTLWDIPIITQTICEAAWWAWVSSSDDVYIWTTQWNWFCISPIFWDWNSDSNLWDWWISWNWWWNNLAVTFKWWDSTNISDYWNWYNYENEKWQTRTLMVADWSSNEINYTCKSLWTASSDYLWSTDNIEWRMKWLATTWNDYAEAQNIDWIDSWTLLNWHAVPALFLADCIDWRKDLWSDMLYKHQPDESLNETITYSQYNVDESGDTSIVDLNNVTYQNRQKYLTAWTQKSWSHLPSAFSYINNNTAWWVLEEWKTDEWNYYTWNKVAMWEYQVACEIWKLWDVSIDWFWDYINWDDYYYEEFILLSAIGNSLWEYWGSDVRNVGYGGCWSQGSQYTGYHSGRMSTRFVIRP